MVPLGSWLIFAGVALLLAMTPGPDMAVTTKNALAHGRRGVVLTTAGISLALCIWVTATAAGLAALLKASADLLLVLKLVGAAYLAYLGLRTLWEARRAPAPLLDGAGPPVAGRSIFGQGFLSCITNPKLGVFFVSFLPQFVQRGGPVFWQLFELGATFALIGLLWLLFYGATVTRARQLITAPRVRQWMERATGIVLLGFGARLAAERL